VTGSTGKLRKLLNRMSGTIYQRRGLSAFDKTSRRLGLDVYKALHYEFIVLAVVLTSALCVCV